LTRLTALTSPLSVRSLRTKRRSLSNCGRMERWNPFLQQNLLGGAK
jgi:hypothetical protein